MLPHCCGDGVQHLHVFRVGIVAWEVVVQLRIERDHLTADGLQHLRREGAGRAVAAGRHHPQSAFQLRPFRQRLDVALAQVRHEHITAAAGRLGAALEHDRFELRHLVRPERQRPLQSHLDAGPAVVVVAGGDHRNALHIERELSEVGHRREGETNVVHLRAARQQPGHQCLLHRGRIPPIIMSDNEALRHTALVGERRQTKPDGIETHQVDLIGKQPAGIVLAKAGGLHERQALEVGRVGLEVGARSGKHRHHHLGR